MVVAGVPGLILVKSDCVPHSNVIGARATVRQLSKKRENSAIELPPVLRRRLGLALLVLYGTRITNGAGIYV